MWLPPHPLAEPESWSHYLSSWVLYFSQIRMNLFYGRGGLNVKRYWLWKEAQASAQKELWTDSRGYYFCNIVTVLPEAQGKGVGRALMEVVLERADKEGMRCYLESSRREPNVGIYEKFGFGLVKEMICDDDGDAIPLFCMIREANGDVEAVATTAP
jgi:GNAT superfamily N-acetyltransferase